MARTRMVTDKQSTKRGAQTILEWDRLIKKAIERAEVLGDQRRLKQLQTALQEGQSAQCLKRMGIISETDIDRELALP